MQLRIIWRKEFQDKVQRMNDEYNLKIYNKMKYLEERERIRKETLEKKKNREYYKK